MFAIPGSIHNPLARGCHQLIRDGATLVETADEIIAALGPLASRLGTHLRERLDDSGTAPPTTIEPARDAHYAKLIDALGHEAIGIDALAERSGLGVPAISSMLLMLELEGKVAAHGGGLYARCHPDART